MRIIGSIRSLLFVLVMLSVSAASSAQVFVSVNFGPPPLPVYEQPLCPGEDYIWVPGYWAWSPVGYYWVPGTWVLAPEPGLLWTPGYWAFGSGLYYWHPGYWGPVVGYYGGIAYGFGYPGAGYYGGYWRDRHFFYNQTVTNVNITQIHYVYRAAVVETTVNRASYNGGPGGIRARPTPEQEAAARERHAGPTSAQMQNEHVASTNRQLLASVNEGRPPVAATAKAAEFSGHGVVAASRAGAPYRASENRAAPSQPNAAAPVSEGRPANRPSRSRTEPGRTSAPAPEAPRPPSASKREVAPPPERVPHSERQVHPENAPRPEAPRPPNPSKREVAPPPGRVLNSERQARPEKAPPQAKAETRPPERKAPPANGEEEHHR